MEDLHQLAFENFSFKKYAENNFLFLFVELVVHHKVSISCKPTFDNYQEKS